MIVIYVSYLRSEVLRLQFIWRGFAVSIHVAVDIIVVVSESFLVERLLFVDSVTANVSSHHKCYTCSYQTVNKNTPHVN